MHWRHYVGNHMVGVHTQRAMPTLLALIIPLAFIWFFTAPILKFWAKITAYLLQSVNRFLQTQNIVFPIMISSGITAASHVFFCWLLVIEYHIGSKGAAMANAISNWVNNVFLSVGSLCVGPGSNFLKLAVPSAIMIW